MKNRPPARSSIEPLEARIAPATFTVTTAADSGPGSFRQAILDANALAGGDLIRFTDEFTQAGVAISLASELPTITDSLSIDPGFFRTVHLDGTNAGDGANGLVFSGAISGNIYGLEISGFDGDGIVVENVPGYVFSDCKIHDNQGNGIRIFGSTNVTLYYDTVLRNGGTGILVEDSSSVKVGTLLSSGPVTYYNTIEGNGLFGVVIRGGNENSVGANRIRGNGGLAEPGEGGGIAVINAQNTNIGDFCRTDGFLSRQYFILGNAIEANEGVGVLIDHSSGTVLTGNTIAANASDGVSLDAASETTFSRRETNYVFDRTLDRLVGNTIAANDGWGVTAVNGTSQLDVRGNVLGPNADGGILLDGVNDAVIGGTTIYYNSRGDTKEETSRDRNIINSGSQPGVVIKNTSGISLISNQFSGAGLPIDLGGDGATLNDLGDTDAGANHLQNYPVLEYVPAVGSHPGRLVGLLDTDAQAEPFLVQAYAYDAATSTYSLVGTQEITTDSNGDGRVVFSGLNGPALFATATNLTTGETSEMSPVTTVALQIDISKGGRRAEWFEADGDRVKLVVSKPVLSFDAFVFGQSDAGATVLKSLVLPAGKGSPVSLDLTVKQSSGDGLLNLETIDATGRDLGSVRVNGSLGSIMAGDSNLKTPGIRELVVNSFGSHPGGLNLTKLESVVQGGINSFQVKGDFTDAHLDVRRGKLELLKIGGSIENSLITVGETSTTSAVRVGKVTVRGDWTESSLAVGASAGVDEMFGTEDDVLNAGLLSKIAQITIGGIVAGTPEAENATDHFGFIAGKIAAFQLGKTQLPLSGSGRDVLELGETSDVTLRERSSVVSS